MKRFVGMMAAATVLALAGTATRVRGANIWDGGGDDDAWGTADNWDDNAVPTFPAALAFGGDTRVTPRNDRGSVTVNGFTFNGDAGSFVIGGDAVTLGGNIVNNSGRPQTLNLPMTVSAQRVVTPGGADVTLGGPISGTGALRVSGAGSLTLSGNNSYAGATTLGGTVAATTRLNIGHANALGTGKLTLPNVTGQTLSFDNTSGGPLAIPNGFDLPTSIQVTFAGTDDLVIGGTTRLKASGPKIEVAAGTLTLATIDADATTQAMQKYGSGTMCVTGAAGATYQGGFTLNSGTLILGHPNALGSGKFAIANGQSVVLQASADLTGDNKLLNSMADFLGILTVSGTNSVELGGKLSRSATTTDMRLNNNLPAGKHLTVNNIDINNNNTTARVLEPGGSGITVVNGTVANGNATLNHGVRMIGTGTLLLNGDNTYGGPTTVNAGTLAAGHANACGTVGAITVNSGGTFAVANGVTFTRAVTFNNGSAVGGIGTLARAGAWILPTAFTVRPGLWNASGALTLDTIGGDVTFGNNTLEVDIRDAVADRWVIAGGGALSLGGATDRLVLRGSARPGVHVLVEAAGGITDTFDVVDRDGLTTSGGSIVYEATRVLFVQPASGTLVTIR